MRDLLEAVAAGDLSPVQAEAKLRAATELRSYIQGPGGRFDAAREPRSGVPEGILADGKEPDETASLFVTSVETTGRAIVTRTDDETADACRRELSEAVPEATVERNGRARTLVAYAPSYQPPTIEATVGVVTAGTSDAASAGEAETIAREMGASIERVDDVGVAGIARVFERLEDLREVDVLVVAAGREGALPTVLAGLVDVPIIGLPISSGYGHGGEGEAALSGMLQSCTALSVVNIDAGFTAGAQAGLIARAIADARGRDSTENPIDS
ncbi:MAG: nickel pincer cofactor biosynthesis protein LarB [Natronomonas sp.]